MNLSRFAIVCDLETSGSDPIRNGIISFTALIVNEALDVVDSYSQNVRPFDLAPHSWSLDAEKVHGMSIAQVLTHMPTPQFCYEFLCFLGKYKNSFPLPFICHASPNGKRAINQFTKKPSGGYDIQPWFDYSFLSWAFRRSYFNNGTEMIWSLNKAISESKLISTVKMGRDAGFKKNNLAAWAERIKFNLNHHDAMSDALCCLEVFKYLQNHQKNL